MELTDSLEFDDDARKELYDYVESHGSVREDQARRALNMDSTAFGHHLTILRRDGYVRKVGNKLQVAYTGEEAEQVELDGLSVTIRTATEDDRESLIEAIRSVAGEGTYIEAETVAEVLDYEEALLRHNEVKSRLFYVACVEGDLVGWVHLDLPEAEKLSHTAVLTVGVRSAYRGRGIGAALLERGTDWAREHGFEKLYNSIPATNEAAIEFLESHGWEVEAVREDHYRIDGEYVDEVMMAVEVN